MSPSSARLLVVLAALAPAAVRASGGPRVAVLSVPSAVAAADAVADAAVDAARQAGAEPVPPPEVARAIAAANGDVATCGTTPACAARVCAALRASALLVTSVTESGRFWLVGVRLREANGGWIKAQAVEAVVRDERAACDSAAKLVARVLSPSSAGATAAVTTPPPRPRLAEVPLPPPPVFPPPPAVRAASPAPTAPPLPPLIAQAPRASPAPETPDERLAARLTAPAPHARAGTSSAASGWGTALVAGGAALISGGAIAGVLAWTESNDASLALARGDVGSYAVKRQYSQTLAVTAAGIGGAGAVALAAGAWLRLGARSSSIALEVEPRAVRLSLAF